MVDAIHKRSVAYASFFGTTTAPATAHMAIQVGKQASGEAGTGEAPLFVMFVHSLSLSLSYGRPECEEQNAIRIGF